jgi:hypothetical protein
MGENEIMNKECELYHYHQTSLSENAKLVATKKEEGKV